MRGSGSRALFSCVCLPFPLFPGHLLADQALDQLFLGNLERILRRHPSEEVDEACDETRPTGLVARAEASAIVAVEVLVEEDQVAPVRVVLELGCASVDRPLAARVAQEDAREPPRDLLRDLEKGHPVPGSRRALDRELVAVEGVE